eukprot:scaffold1260_cov254-Pinguiococcus_pyrenoidosus.AAC.5
MLKKRHIALAAKGLHTLGKAAKDSMSTAGQIWTSLTVMTASALAKSRGSQFLPRICTPAKKSPFTIGPKATVPTAVFQPTDKTPLRGSTRSRSS